MSPPWGDYCMREAIAQKLRQIVLTCAELPDAPVIDEDTELIRDLDFGSMKIIEVVLEIEGMFDIEIDDDDLLMDILTSFRNLIDIVIKQLERKQSA